MTSARAVADRIPLDAYYTPDDVARRCVGALSLRACSRVLEPSVGGGAFARALLAEGHRVDAIDINPEAPGLALPGLRSEYALDFLDFGKGPRGVETNPALDAIVGNPPFSHAQSHVEHALAVVREGGTVAFLLRLAFLEGQKRAAFWREHAPVVVHVLSARPSFTGGGTDSAAYGFFVWRRGARSGEPRLGWLP